jgi:hypothetical protein
MPQVAQRLPNSSGAGKPPSFKIDDEGWNEFEAVLGATSTEARAELVMAFDGYLWTKSAELAADDLDQAVKVARRRQSDVARAWKTLSKPSTSDAEDLVYTIFARNLHHSLILDDLDDEIKSEIVISVLRAADAACAQTLKDILSGEHTGRPPGRSWEALVRTFLAILERHELPSTIRKDSDVYAEQSPCVYAFDLLQSRFEPEYRRATHSMPALADAMDKARGSKA